jgi:hypothetical protein
MTQSTDSVWTPRGGRPGQPPGAQGPTHERIPVPTRQRRPALAALALVLVLGGAALSGFLVLNSGQKQSVLVLAKEVPYGHTFENSDFREEQLSLTGDIKPVLFSQLGQLLSGRYKATTRIPAGSVLTYGMVAPARRQPIPGSNYTEFGVTVPEGQYPAGGLAEGDIVKVLYTPTTDKGLPAGGIKNGTPLPAGMTLVNQAYVSAVQTAAGGQGGLLVSLVVRNEDLTSNNRNGLAVAAAANAIKSISLVRLPEFTEPVTGDSN